LQNYVVYNKLYNYFEPIPIPDPENPKFESRICKPCSKPKRIEKEKNIKD
jgi:hypothetical protein